MQSKPQATTLPLLPSLYLAIDEHGRPFLDEEPVVDQHKCFEILNNIGFAANGAFQTSIANRSFLIEAFDEPYVVQSVTAPKSNMSITWQATMPYDVNKSFELKTLSLDEWDRFHGITAEGIPFVFSAKAQDEFFSQLDSYTDNTITFREKIHNVPLWFQPESEVEKEEFWTNIYKNETPRWDLGGPTPALKEMLTRVKFPKSRVLVLGCGKGHDAALLAEKGHVVTAVDISPEAISAAKHRYGNFSNLHFIEGDIFKLPNLLKEDFDGRFDLVFEHTCYCAINPNKRNELVALWRRALHSQGQILGIFFSMEGRQCPPFGGSEWEVRARLKKYFRFLFWGRYHTSIDRRNGKEFIVFAQKKSTD